jgi:hypothetical protein
LSTKLMSTFADRGSRVLSAADPHVRILGFLGWSQDRKRTLVLTPVRMMLKKKTCVFAVFFFLGIPGTFNSSFYIDGTHSGFGTQAFFPCLITWHISSLLTLLRTVCVACTSCMTSRAAKHCTFGVCDGQHSSDEFAGHRKTKRAA